MLTKERKYHIHHDDGPVCQCEEKPIRLAYCQGENFYKTHLCRPEDLLMYNDICDECFDEWISWMASVEQQKEIEDRRDAIRESLAEETKETEIKARKVRLKELLDGCG